MTAKHPIESERACLQAADDFLSPEELFAVALMSGSKPVRSMKKAALRVMRERLHKLRAGL